MWMTGFDAEGEADAWFRVQREAWGEGTEATGNMFQISNQITLGEKESEIVKNLEQIVLAGAFGSYIDLDSAMTVGLLPMEGKGGGVMPRKKSRVRPDRDGAARNPHGEFRTNGSCAG